MALIQPKPYLDKMSLRRHAYGTERRRNMSKMILDYGTPLPKPIEYADIDRAMFDWVDKVLDLNYDGKRLPTYKLYSSQRIGEYIETWKQLDETGNIVMNFKTVTREFNPQKGESQGSYFNIPGHKDFTMFYIPVLQENGTEAYDRYTMKQPFAVNFIYTVAIISNKMELVNEMNERMQYEFSAINCYISPNDHPMPMSLEDISDESEYSIDDRKFYSQTYRIKVKGYIIRKEDFKVERIPSRFVVSSKDMEKTFRRGKNRKDNEKVTFMTGDFSSNSGFQGCLLENIDPCNPIGLPTIHQKPSEIYEESSGNTDCCMQNDARYMFRRMRIIVVLDNCGGYAEDGKTMYSETSFVIDKDMVWTSVELSNVYDYKVLVNNEDKSNEDDYRFLDGDTITVRATRKDEFNEARLTLVGYDPNEAVDMENGAETVLDEPYDEEEILVDPTAEAE